MEERKGQDRIGEFKGNHVRREWREKREEGRRADCRRKKGKGGEGEMIGLMG